MPKLIVDRGPNFKRLEYYSESFATLFTKADSLRTLYGLRPVGDQWMPSRMVYSRKRGIIILRAAYFFGDK